MKISLKTLKLMGVMLLVLLLGAFFLFFVGEDALEGKNEFQFFADSTTYHKLSRGEMPGVGDDFALLDISSSTNYLGPLVVLRLMGDNVYLILLFNVALFSFSIRKVASLLKLDPVKVTLLLLINPLTISSLLSVNKEIFFFPFLAFVISGYMRRSLSSVVIALVMSILIRWQVTLFYVVLLAASCTHNIFRRRRTILVLLLGAASLGYLVVMGWIQPVLESVALSTSEYEGSGIYEALLGFQNQGLYWAVFPVKAGHLLFAMGLRVDRLVAPTNIYNDVFVVLHSLATLIVFVFMLRRNFSGLKSDLFFISVIYLVVFCLSPVYAPRYLYFVYVIWVLIVSGASDSMRGMPEWFQSKQPSRRRGALCNE